MDDSPRSCEAVGCVPQCFPSPFPPLIAHTLMVRQSSEGGTRQGDDSVDEEAAPGASGLGDQGGGETELLCLPPELAAVVGLFAPRVASTCTMARRALVRAAVRGEVQWAALGSVIIQAIANKHTSTLTAFLEGATDAAKDHAGLAPALGAHRWVHTAFAALLRVSASSWRTTQGSGVADDGDAGREQDFAVASALLHLIERSPTEGKLSALELELALRHFPTILRTYLADDRLGRLRGSFSWEQVVTVAARFDDEELARYALVRVEELDDPASAMAVATSRNSHRTLACLLARAECDPRARSGALLYRAASDGHMEAFRVLLSNGTAWSDPDGVRILRSALAAAPATARSALARCVRDVAGLDLPAWPTSS